MSVNTPSFEPAITTYTGPMRSGKSGLLIMEYNRARSVGKKILALKPEIDNRFGKNTIASRDSEEKDKIPATCIRDLKDIAQYDAEIYFVDEAQFLFGDVGIISEMACHGKEFYIAGLDMTSEGKPFGVMSDILSISDEVVKRTARCAICGCKNARYSFFLGGKKGDIEIGDKNYIPLCRPHWCEMTQKRELGLIE